VLVAPAARAAACEDDARVRARQVGDQLPFGAERLRPDGHAELDARAVRAVLAGTAAGLPSARLEPRLRPEAREVPQPLVRDEHDVAAAAAVAAVGPAPRHVLLTAEAQPPVAAATRQHLDAGAVVEHGL
jgi:hypothetical protein